MNTVIVTYGRGWPALAVVRSLGSQGVRVVCGDSVPLAPATLSKHCAEKFRYPDPKQDPEGFLNRLEEVVLANQTDDGEVVLMPVHAESFLVAKHRERFEKLGARMALPSYEHIEQTHDKGSLALLAEELGINIPTTRHYTSLEDMRAEAEVVSYPAFVKVRGSAAGCGIRKVSNAEELVSAYTEFVEGYELAPEQYPLVQEFVPGDDYCLSALFEHGKCIALHTYHNIRQFPATTGAGVLRETVPAPKAEAMATKLLSHLGWHGLAQLDFRWDEDGEPTLIELNPRFFGGLPQAIASGVDHPYMVYQLALGQTPATPEIDYTVRTETPVLGLLATATTVGKDLRDGKIEDGFVAHTKKELAPHKDTINDVWRWNDPMPALGVFFPFALAIKHGSMSTAVVLSEARMKAEKTGFRGYLKPNAKTLLATGLVFLLSLLCTTWAVTDGTVVDTFFSLPSHLGALVPHGLVVAANFVFLYVLAAFGLKLREEVKTARAEAVA